MYCLDVYGSCHAFSRRLNALLRGMTASILPLFDAFSSQDISKTWENNSVYTFILFCIRKSAKQMPHASHAPHSASASPLVNICRRASIFRRLSAAIEFQPLLVT